MKATHVVLNNSELGKITREQASAMLSIKDRAQKPHEVRGALAQSLAHQGPTPVEKVSASLGV